MILHPGRVPVIDSTGFVALQNASASLVRHEQHVVLAGPLPKPRSVFAKARLEDMFSRLHVADDLAGAIEMARRLVAGSP